MRQIAICLAWAAASTWTIAYAQQPLTHTQHGQLRTVINPAASLMAGGGEVSV
ncbi:hypothetical protein CLV26_1201, partial [Parapedobacter indicus]